MNDLVKQLTPTDILVGRVVILIAYTLSIFELAKILSGVFQ